MNHVSIEVVLMAFFLSFFCSFSCLLSMENIKYFPVILEWIDKYNWDMLTDYIYIYIVGCSVIISLGWGGSDEGKIYSLKWLYMAS